MSVLTVCLSPGIQRSALLDAFVPTEVNRIRQVFVDVSGKGINVGRVLKRLGCPVVCLAQGGDNQAELMDLAQTEGLPLQLVPARGRVRTCTSIIELGSGGRVTELVEPATPVDPACTSALSNQFDSLLPASTALVVAGSMAAGFPVDLQAQMIQRATQAGVPSFVDLHGEALKQALVQKPTIVKINLMEFSTTFLPARWHARETMGINPGLDLTDGLAEALVRTAGDLGCDFILTQGPGPVMLIRQGRLSQIPVPAIPPGQIISPIGSGDAFMAGLVASLHQHNCLAVSTKTPDSVIQTAIGLAIACAQSNARTARPGWLHEDFTQQPD